MAKQKERNGAAPPMEAPTEPKASAKAGTGKLEKAVRALLEHSDHRRMCRRSKPLQDRVGAIEAALG